MWLKEMMKASKPQKNASMLSVFYMNLDNTLFDTIQQLAEESPRRRMHFDLRTEADPPAGIGHEQWTDQSQRILNVMMPDTDVPIHKHSYTSETIVICRGKVRCECYDETGNKISEHILEASGNCPGVQIPMGVYHTTRCLVPGSVIFEAKDRPYDPELTEEFLKL